MIFNSHSFSLEKLSNDKGGDFSSSSHSFSAELASTKKQRNSFSEPLGLHEIKIEFRTIRNIASPHYRYALGGESKGYLDSLVKNLRKLVASDDIEGLYRSYCIKVKGNFSEPRVFVRFSSPRKIS
jgi:hypothetical protein